MIDIVRVPIFTSRRRVQSEHVQKYYERLRRRVGSGTYVLDVDWSDPEAVQEQLVLLLAVNGHVYFDDRTRTNLFHWVKNNKHMCSLSILFYGVEPTVPVWEIIWILNSLSCRLQHVFVEFKRTEKVESWTDHEDAVLIGNEYRCSDDFQMRFMQALSDFLIAHHQGIEVVSI